MVNVEKEGVVLKDDGTIKTDEFTLFRDNYNATEVCIHSGKYHYGVYVSLDKLDDLIEALQEAKKMWGK